MIIRRKMGKSLEEWKIMLNFAAENNKYKDERNYDKWK